MKNTIFIILCFFSNLQYAQLETHTWYFSPTSKGIKFDLTSNIPSVVSSHTPLSSLHGCGVATNPANGNVMFYTDGVTVYDATNLQMPNGSGLSSGSSCAQKGLLVLIPGSCDRYYVFCNTANDPTSGSIYYSIVNMSLPGNGSSGSPLGDIETANKNIFIANTTTEAFTIIPNSNGNYWLIIPSNASDAIRIYNISSSGISYISTFNTGYTISGSFSIKYSKEASKVAYISTVENQASLIMNFNANTGVFSTVTPIPGTPLGPNSGYFYPLHDAEFSPDGTKLYISKYRMSTPAGPGSIYQYDLNFPSTPITSVYTISSTDVTKNCTGLQTGPDGKIYFIYSNLIYNDDRLIGAINSPNIAGTGCNINPSALDLGVSQSNNSRFPEFIHYSAVSLVANNSNVTLTVSCQLNYGTINIQNPSAPNPISIIGAIHGSASLTINDSIHYVSNTGFIGMDTISYLICDTSCFPVCDTGYVFVSVEDCETGISDFGFEENLWIYPNPNSGTFYVNCSKTCNLNFELYNLLGEIIYQQKLNSFTNKIGLEKLNDGIYFIKISNTEKKYIQRIIINN